MSALGITRLANITGLDRIGIPVVQAIRPNSRSVSTSQGKGESLDAAKASALMADWPRPQPVAQGQGSHHGAEDRGRLYQERDSGEKVILDDVTLINNSTTGTLRMPGLYGFHQGGSFRGIERLTLSLGSRH